MKPRRIQLLIWSLLIATYLIGCDYKNDNNSDISNKGVVSDEKSHEDPDDNIDNNINDNNISENKVDRDHNDDEIKPKLIPVYLDNDQELIYTVEAEDGIFTGNVMIESGASGYQGSGYVKGFEADEDTCTVKVSVKQDGMYDMNFISASIGGYKENYIYVDGENLGVISTDNKEFSDVVLERVYLTVGEHEVTVKKYWGWIMLDRVEVYTSRQINPDKYKIKPILANKNASENAKRLMSYLCDIYDEYFLSGQYCDTGRYGKEFVVINKTTGKTPAILGLDFIEYTPSRVEMGSKGSQTELAINFWKEGGIVTFCWHWNAPSKYLTKEWYRGFYTEATNINLKRIMDGQDKEGYDLLMKDIDAIAKELLKLQEAEVPILWRPLHEASGGWFWWGASGPEAYIELYKLLYERLTNEYQLNNLIWVWNGQDKDWYPGDEYVDIIGEDIYPGERVYTSQVARYLKALDYTSSAKLTYLTENGCLFDPDLAIRDGAMWGSWCTWGGEFVAKDIGIHTLSEQYTEADMLIKVYSHENVLNLEDLPNITTYPIGE
ncbi:MAG: beta-mannosidase [Anaerolineaceae bacterium]|nr:MAG: beta-mannosidase [Anaerolineaceae bacterium]